MCIAFIKEFILARGTAGCEYLWHKSTISSKVEGFGNAVAVGTAVSSYVMLDVAPSLAPAIQPVHPSRPWAGSFSRRMCGKWYPRLYCSPGRQTAATAFPSSTKWVKQDLPSKNPHWLALMLWLLLKCPLMVLEMICTMTFPSVKVMPVIPWILFAGLFVVHYVRQPSPPPAAWLLLCIHASEQNFKHIFFTLTLPLPTKKKNLLSFVCCSKGINWNVQKPAAAHPAPEMAFEVTKHFPVSGSVCTDSLCMDALGCGFSVSTMW